MPAGSKGGGPGTGEVERASGRVRKEQGLFSPSCCLQGPNQVSDGGGKQKNEKDSGQQNGHRGHVGRGRLSKREAGVGGQGQRGLCWQGAGPQGRASAAGQSVVSAAPLPNLHPEASIYNRKRPRNHPAFQARSF